MVSPFFGALQLERASCCSSEVEASRPLAEFFVRTSEEERGL